MGAIKDVSKFVAQELAPTATDPIHRRWQWKIFGLLLFIMVVLVLHLIAAKGMLTNFGISPIVYANELEMHVSKQVAPIATSVTELTQTVKAQGREINQQGKELRESLQFEYAEKIRDAALARCEAKEAREKRRISDTIERLQVAYQNVTQSETYPTGKRYAVPICDGNNR